MSTIIETFSYPGGKVCPDCGSREYTKVGDLVSEEETGLGGTVSEIATKSQHCSGCSRKFYNPETFSVDPAKSGS